MGLKSDSALMELHFSIGTISAFFHMLGYMFAHMFGYMPLEKNLLITTQCFTVIFRTHSSYSGQSGVQVAFLVSISLGHFFTWPDVTAIGVPSVLYKFTGLGWPPIVEK